MLSFEKCISNHAKGVQDTGGINPRQNFEQPKSHIEEEKGPLFPSQPVILHSVGYQRFSITSHNVTLPAV